eukprot:362322-Chlamydomonas_euryale.AAC.19
MYGYTVSRGTDGAQSCLQVQRTWVVDGRRWEEPRVTGWRVWWVAGKVTGKVWWGLAGGHPLPALRILCAAMAGFR